MKLAPKNKAKDIFEQFCAGYQQRDLNILLPLFTKESNVWGTALDEYRVGLDEIKGQFQRDWQQSDAGKISIQTIVPAPQDATWFAAICNTELTINGEVHQFSDLRGTIIIAEEEGEWRISHMHASFPDFRNAEASSFPTN